MDRQRDYEPARLYEKICLVHDFRFAPPEIEKSARTIKSCSFLIMLQFSTLMRRVRLRERFLLGGFIIVVWITVVSLILLYLGNWDKVQSNSTFICDVCAIYILFGKYFNERASKSFCLSLKFTL